jgi:hypothetical protein
MTGGGEAGRRWWDCGDYFVEGGGALEAAEELYGSNEVSMIFRRREKARASESGLYNGGKSQNPHPCKNRKDGVHAGKKA